MQIRTRRIQLPLRVASSNARLSHMPCAADPYDFLVVRNILASARRWRLAPNTPLTIRNRDYSAAADADF